MTRPVPDTVHTLGSVFHIMSDRRSWEAHSATGIAGRSLGSWREVNVAGVTVHVTSAGNEDAMLWLRGSDRWSEQFTQAYMFANLDADGGSGFALPTGPLGAGLTLDKAKEQVLLTIIRNLESGAASRLIDAAILRERAIEFQL